MELPLEPAPVKVWTLSRDGMDASCDMQAIGEGVVVRMLRDGIPFVAFRFATEGDGLTCAETERERLLTAGWIDRDPIGEP